MPHQLSYTQSAREDLLKLERKTAARILKKILFFSQQKDPLIFARKLKSSVLASYRFRIGDYRVFFDLNWQGQIQILMILRIKHRKDIYNLV